MDRIHRLWQARRRKNASTPAGPPRGDLPKHFCPRLPLQTAAIAEGKGNENGRAQRRNKPRDFQPHAKNRETRGRGAQGNFRLTLPLFFRPLETAAQPTNVILNFYHGQPFAIRGFSAASRRALLPRLSVSINADRRSVYRLDREAGSAQLGARCRGTSLQGPSLVEPGVT